jgi:hypothetical protein
MIAAFGGGDSALFLSIDNFEEPSACALEPETPLRKNRFSEGGS